MDGEWRDTTGSVIAPTDHDSTTIMELAGGFEYRYHFGRRLDHTWTVGLLAEHQRWESSWMTEFIGSSTAFSGANINFGVTW